MNRRTFLRASAAWPALAAASRLPGLAAFARAAQREFAPQPGTWRTFEVTTRVEILKPVGATRVWLPVPVVRSDFQKPLGDTWSGNAKVVELTSRVETEDRAVDWSRKGLGAAVSEPVERWTRPTKLMPTDGIVRATAVRITRGRTTELEKVEAVYDWILANTYREPTVRGCGVGDIRAMLDANKLGTLGFFMYPQAETAEGRRDSLDADAFRYTITSRAI